MRNYENQIDSSNTIEVLLQCIDIARILKISRSKAYLLVKSGEIPSIHIGKSVRVRPDDLRAFIFNRLTSNNCDF